MARHPGSTWHPLPENFTQPRIAPTQIILHTAVDGANTNSLYGWFDTGTTLESHFYAQKGGTGEQYIDTEIRADANNKANGRAVSIEAWDGQASIPKQPYQPYTNAQIGYLVGLLGWLCDTHQIPRRLCPGWDQPGIGWHNMFREWSPTPTGCPGDPRIDQIRNVILPALNAPAPPPEEDDDMKSIVGFDPRQDQWYHLCGNQAVRITGEAAGFLKAIGVADVGALHPQWLEGCHITDGGGL